MTHSVAACAECGAGQRRPSVLQGCARVQRGEPECSFADLSPSEGYVVRCSSEGCTTHLLYSVQAYKRSCSPLSQVRPVRCLRNKQEWRASSEQQPHNCFLGRLKEQMCRAAA